MFNVSQFFDEARPSPCLLNAIYLWGIALSASPVMSAQEPIFLSRSLYHLGTLSQHRGNELQRVQTYILLSNYFMRSGHTNEGKSHSNAAIWLAMKSGFHKPATSPAPSPGAVDPADKLAAFWAAFYLDKCWSLLLTLPSVCPDQRNAADEDRIDIPWPADVDKPVSVSYRSSSSKQYLIAHLSNVDPCSKPTTIHRYRYTLFERSTRQPW